MIGSQVKWAFSVCERLLEKSVLCRRDASYNY
jgi:hypothetical protein